MPVERVVAVPLSGKEIRTAILDRISSVLRKDCNLNDNLAYEGGFSCHITISLKAKDIGREIESKLDETVQQGDPEETAALDAKDKELEMTSLNPNETRVETGQEVPVVAKDSEGKDTIRGVKYSRDAAKRVK